MAAAAAALASRMWGRPGAGGAERPSDVKSVVGRVASRFLGYDQQDAQEFLRFFLDALHEDSCRLGVPIPKAAQVRARRAGPFASAAAVGGACSLDECVAAFTAPEDLAKQGYRCPGCKAEACVKTTQVWRGPAVLVVVVKRFAYSAFRRAKISVSVELPQALDLRPFCAKGAPALRGRTDYSLWGVVNHSGSLHGGHYTADCRNADTGQWFCFNDSRVSTSRRPTGGASPYLLFYVRNDAAPGVGHRDGGRL
ncbi:hypothetical protein FNF28_06103 [Cafeteria roenbergensis]|uniref:USP domain-containing protein n=1 Tax=Cafeteria roenbergensis TaxID=33653 RepID=A0A5A8D3D3_CAFRO|nr:hypothetical protein FNF28_06103 [Cafeteria roenbergensis]